MAEFESSDLYFQPDDPAVWNPESFSPQQRLRNYLPRWPGAIKPQYDYSPHNQSPRSSLVRYNSCSSNSPTATHYLISATADHTHNNKTSPPLIAYHHRHHTSIPAPPVTDSPGSLTGTSSSSEAAEVKDDSQDDYDDAESYCGSLTYSVESEFKHNHHHHSVASAADHFFFPHSVSTLPEDVVDDLYEDAVERLDHETNSEKKNKKPQQDCFQPGDCFHPLAWIAELFRGTTPSKKNSSLWVEEDDLERL
jgi:hypothetical protein